MMNRSSCLLNMAIHLCHKVQITSFYIKIIAKRLMARKEIIHRFPQIHRLKKFHNSMNLDSIRKLLTLALYFGTSVQKGSKMTITAEMNVIALEIAQ